MNCTNFSDCKQTQFRLHVNRYTQMKHIKLQRTNEFLDGLYVDQFSA